MILEMNGRVPNIKEHWCQRCESTNVVRVVDLTTGEYQDFCGDCRATMTKGVISESLKSIYAKYYTSAKSKRDEDINKELSDEPNH
jgi:hypothetical protein